jgi:hypothetical protein
MRRDFRFLPMTLANKNMAKPYLEITWRMLVVWDEEKRFRAKNGTRYFCGLHRGRSNV